MTDFESSWYDLLRLAFEIENAKYKFDTYAPGTSHAESASVETVIASAKKLYKSFGELGDDEDTENENVAALVAEIAKRDKLFRDRETGIAEQTKDLRDELDELRRRVYVDFGNGYTTWKQVAENQVPTPKPVVDQDVRQVCDIHDIMSKIKNRLEQQRETVADAPPKTVEHNMWVSHNYVAADGYYVCRITLQQGTPFFYSAFESKNHNWRSPWCGISDFEYYTQRFETVDEAKELMREIGKCK